MIRAFQRHHDDSPAAPRGRSFGHVTDSPKDAVDRVVRALASAVRERLAQAPKATRTKRTR